MPKGERLDRLLVERGLAPSRERAQRLILAGRVTVKGVLADKAGSAFPPDADIAVKEDPCPYVSGGGLKLAAALDEFTISPEGRFFLDVGQDDACAFCTKALSDCSTDSPGCTRDDRDLVFHTGCLQVFTLWD